MGAIEEIREQGPSGPLTYRFAGSGWTEDFEYPESLFSWLEFQYWQLSCFTRDWLRRFCGGEIIALLGLAMFVPRLLSPDWRTRGWLTTLIRLAWRLGELVLAAGVTLGGTILTSAAGLVRLTVSTTGGPWEAPAALAGGLVLLALGLALGLRVLGQLLRNR